MGSADKKLGSAKHDAGFTIQDEIIITLLKFTGMGSGVQIAIHIHR